MLGFILVNVLTDSVIRVREFQVETNGGSDNISQCVSQGGKYSQNPVVSDSRSGRAASVPEIGGTVSIKTAKLHVDFENKVPVTSSLVIRSEDAKENGFSWKCGQKNEGRLPGTVRTLDNVLGKIELSCDAQHRNDLHCEMGAISRNGWVVFDNLERQNIRYKNSAAKDAAPFVKAIERPKRTDIEEMLELNQTATFGSNSTFCEWQMLKILSETQVKKMTTVSDFHFFGHQLDFISAMGDFSFVLGQQHFLPEYVFGTWFSRWWGYSQDELLQDLRRMKQSQIPIPDVVVLDMDWHKTFYRDAWYKGEMDVAGFQKGWSGWSWNTDLYPNPKEFVERVKKDFGVKAVTVNLHPGSGVLKHEDCFKPLVHAVCSIYEGKMGLKKFPGCSAIQDKVRNDPEFHLPWTFLMSDADYKEAFGEICMKPLEMDFYWIDWQQGENINLFVDGKTDPFLKYYNEKRARKKNVVSSSFSDGKVASTSSTSLGVTSDGKSFSETTPTLEMSKFFKDYSISKLVFNRWGGLGAHTVAPTVGFSGDVVQDWRSLAFQPEFTASASNVGFHYWSHDIGGFSMSVDPSLFTRWVQWGAVSPILRLHSSKFFGHANHRSAYQLAEPYRSAVVKALHFRDMFKLYLSTLSGTGTKTGLGLIRPLYYLYPEDEDAYTSTSNHYGYFLGFDLLCYPHTSSPGRYLEVPNFPAGHWIEWNTGKHLNVGARSKTAKKGYSQPKQFFVDLDEIPVFGRSGSAILFGSSADGSIPHLILFGEEGDVEIDRISKNKIGTDSAMNVHKVETTAVLKRAGIEHLEWNFSLKKISLKVGFDGATALLGAKLVGEGMSFGIVGADFLRIIDVKKTSKNGMCRMNFRDELTADTNTPQYSAPVWISFDLKKLESMEGGAVQCDFAIEAETWLDSEIKEIMIFSRDSGFSRMSKRLLDVKRDLDVLFPVVLADSWKSVVLAFNHLQELLGFYLNPNLVKNVMLPTMIRNYKKVLGEAVNEVRDIHFTLISKKRRAWSLGRLGDMKSLGKYETSINPFDFELIYWFRSVGEKVMWCLFASPLATWLVEPCFRAFNEGDYATLAFVGALIFCLMITLPSFPIAFRRQLKKKAE